MTATSIPWARIMAPVAGAFGDGAVIEAASVLAAPFDAELAAVFAPADVADLMPWMGDGFMGGVQVAAVESLKEAAAEGLKAARAAFAACAYPNKRFIALESPVWSSLSMHSRLSDVVVFGSDAARGRGPLAQAFQQMIAAEQRPVVVARPGLDPAGVMAVAWDGGKEASRAMRTALPLLQRARAVHIVASAASSARVFDPEALRAASSPARGVQAETTPDRRRWGGGRPAAQGGAGPGRQPVRRRRLRPPPAAGIHLRRRDPGFPQCGRPVAVPLALARGIR